MKYFDLRKFDFREKKALVIGTGLSGIGAAWLLHKEGARVTVLDQNAGADKEKIRQKIAAAAGKEADDIEIIIGELPGGAEPSFDLAVPSPAVPLDSPVIVKLQEADVPVLSEIELGSLFDKGTILAITGTNGKTTTTTLVGEIMKAAAEKGASTSGSPFSRSFVVGNIGFSYAQAALNTSPDSVTVGEISSFQLEAAHTFHPAVSAILNITPDHLNRHYTMENYAAIKEKIAKNQTPEEVCVLNYEDPCLRPYGEHLCPAHVVWFSSKRKLKEGFFLDGDMICRADGKGGESRILLDFSQTRLVGTCNAENIMAAMAITAAAGVPEDLIISVVKDFPPVPHRIEFIAKKKGVRYYNDSKATNPDAAIQGIRAMSAPTILIGGGYDKKNSYDDWIEAFDNKVKKLVLIGQTREDIAACAEKHGFTSYEFCETFDECLRRCTELASEGDAVLLSPACASWGMFPNYEVRGDIFREYVLGLPDSV